MRLNLLSFSALAELMMLKECPSGSRLRRYRERFVYPHSRCDRNTFSRIPASRSVNLDSLNLVLVQYSTTTLLS